MRPEVRQHVAERARSLQLRLDHGRVDPITAASEALRIVTDAADGVRTRWLNLELGGYGDLVDSSPLHLVLGVPVNDRLAVHVAAYRTQRGLTVDAVATTAAFRHFFVESLAELVKTRAAVASTGGSSSLELEFATGPGASAHPRSGTFGWDVFDRIVSGFVAALHLQLGVLVK